MFYHVLPRGKHIGTIKGFPLTRGSWCKHLKYGSKVDLSRYLLSSDSNKGRQEDIRVPDETDALVQLRSKTESDKEVAPQYAGGGTPQRIQYLGIAVDEPERLTRLDGVNKVSPLEAMGWTEADCRKWCEENNLLSPIYTTATRGGCWFCHNQGVDQLRQLRKNYPDLWQLLLKWDKDSPVTFHSNGKTVHDYDKRFMLEDLREIPMDRTFRWKMQDPPEES